MIWHQTITARKLFKIVFGLFFSIFIFGYILVSFQVYTKNYNNKLLLQEIELTQNKISAHQIILNKIEDIKNKQKTIYDIAAKRQHVINLLHVVAKSAIGTVSLKTFSYNVNLLQIDAVALNEYNITTFMQLLRNNQITPSIKGIKRNKQYLEFCLQFVIN